MVCSLNDFCTHFSAGKYEAVNHLIWNKSRILFETPTLQIKLYGCLTVPCSVREFYLTNICNAWNNKK